MTRQELLERLERINVSRRGNRPALYKPLLLLVLLSRVQTGGIRSFQFRDIEAQLRSLIERFSPRDSPESVGQPWWHLPTDGLWTVLDDEGHLLRESGTPRGDQRVPPLDELRRQHGEFPGEIRELILNDPDAVLAAIDLVLKRHLLEHESAIRATLQIGPTTKAPETVQTLPRRIGRPYSNVGSLPRAANRDPFEVDPDVIDRGNQAHASTVDALADFLRGNGIEPLSPDRDQPMFDLAWERNGVVFVAEVKSVTAANEEKQLRLGLGQVLWYRQQFESSGLSTVPVLVPERRPTAQGWTDLCGALGVRLVWPGTFEALL